MPLVTKLIIELIDIQDEENIYKKQKKQMKKEFIKNIKMKNEVIKTTIYSIIGKNK